jgi:hypothetical protein
MAALVITPELEAAAQKLAQRSGKTPTEAVVEAVRKELEILPALPPQRDGKKIRAIIREFHSAPVDYSLTEDEILGYDEDGIPEQPYLGR